MFNEPLGGLTTNHMIAPMAMFITSKGYKTQTAMRKGAWNTFQQKPGTSFQKSFPSGIKAGCA